MKLSEYPAAQAGSGLLVSTVTGCSSAREHLNAEGPLHHQQTRNHEVLCQVIMSHSSPASASCFPAFKLRLDFNTFKIPVCNHSSAHCASFQLFNMSSISPPPFPMLSPTPACVPSLCGSVLNKRHHEHTAQNVLIKSYWQFFNGALVWKKQPKKKKK